MIPVKDAVNAATNYMKELLGDLPGLLVEEVEWRSGQPSVWAITMGYWQLLPDRPEPQPMNSALSAYLGLKGTPKRAYKEIIVSAQDGSIRSMKVRIIPGAP
jgi:hypothetical protein